MAKITRIKASDSPKKEEKSSEPTITRKKVVVEDKKSAKNKQKEIRKAAKNISSDEKPKKKVFILFRPFVALFNYIRGSWHEIRQVRWPNRKTTWKMLLGMVVYTAIFMVLIFLLDMFFSWLFNLILGK